SRCHICLNKSWCDAIDGDLPFGQFLGERFRRPNNSRFRGCIVGLTAIANQTGYGRKGDNSPPLTCPYHGQHYWLEQIIKGIQVGMQDTIPISTREQGKGCISGNSSVTYHPPIESTRLYIMGNGRLRSLSVCNIEGYEVGRAPSSGDFFHGLCRRCV